MPRINNYFSDEEFTYIKKQDKGFIRMLVQNAMEFGLLTVEADKETLLQVGPYIPPAKKSGDGKTNCKKCGALLTTYKGKCKIC